MKTLIFDDSEFEGGTIHWNNLELDEALPLESQLDYLWEDMIFVSFPSGCAIFVDWLPAFDPHGTFVISLVQNPDRYQPLHRRRCRSVDILKDTVRQYVKIAKTTTERYVLKGHGLPVLKDLSSSFFNELVFDMSRPLAEQPERLKSRLFEAHMPGHAFTIGWHPAHDPSGQFVLTLYRDPAEWKDYEFRSDPAAWQALATRQCRAVDELRPAAEELLQYVIESDEAVDGPE